MICPPCSEAANAGNLKHGVAVCAWPSSCTCQHGQNIECDPNADSPGWNLYVDMLPEAERVAAYARHGRTVPSLAQPTERELREMASEEFAAVVEENAQAIRAAMLPGRMFSFPSEPMAKED